MSATLKRKLAIGTAALAAAAFAGGAYAATSGTNERQAFLNDVAKRLNVSPAQLNNALQGAFLDQLQAAVKAGKLTQAQADAIKKRVQQSGSAPFGFGAMGLLKGGPRMFFFRGGPALKGGPGAGHNRLSAAASYLGITQAQLFDQLQAGKTLAQIAKAHGKSVPGLKAAMTAAIKSKLDKAVAAKMLTSAQEQQILSDVSSMLDAQINGTLPRFHGGFGHGLGPGFGRAWRGPSRAYPAYPLPPAGAPAPPTVY